jgi:hypothetical protein
MDQIDFQAIAFSTCGVLAAVAFIFTLKWVLVKGFGLSLFSGAVNSYRDACRAANRFIDKLNRVRQKIALLEPYTSEYVHVFQSSGWVTIIGIFESLEYAESELDKRIKNRDYDGAVALAEFLCTRDPLLADDFISQDGFKFVSLVMWEKQLFDHLTTLLDELQMAAETMAGIGVVRKRERAPTLLTVDAIRRQLMEMATDSTQPGEAIVERRGNPSK